MSTPQKPSSQKPAPSYTVSVTNAARRELRRLHPDYQKAFNAIIEGLKTTPRPTNAEPMKGVKSRNQYRIRLRDFRIIYAVEDDKVLVLVLHISPRGEVYRPGRRSTS